MMLTDSQKEKIRVEMWQMIVLAFLCMDGKALLDNNWKEPIGCKRSKPFLRALDKASRRIISTIESL